MPLVLDYVARQNTNSLQVFAALSETLNNQVRLVATEKNDLTEEAQRIITNIKQMEASLDDNRDHHEYEPEDDGLQITYPLMQCLQGLKEKHSQVYKLHRERYEQVKSALQSVSIVLRLSVLTEFQNLSKLSSHIHPTWNRPL